MYEQKFYMIKYRKNTEFEKYEDIDEFVTYDVIDAIKTRYAYAPKKESEKKHG